jgi:mono/diheme cytochrome c family protein
MRTLGLVAIVSLLALNACSKHAASSAPGPAVATPRADDVAHGAIVFRENCAACHGASGTEGGVGPSLRDERARKNFARAVAWIENPDPPMPKLYPGTLGRKDVDDVAAYVEGL